MTPPGKAFGSAAPLLLRPVWPVRQGIARPSIEANRDAGLRPILRSTTHRILAGVRESGLSIRFCTAGVACSSIADAESIRRLAVVARRVAQSQIAFKSQRLDNQSVIEVGEENLRGLAVYRPGDGNIATRIAVGGFVEPKPLVASSTELLMMNWGSVLGSVEKS